MNWKSQLEQLEKNKNWDPAIELMQKVIAENPNNVDAAIKMNFLLMNLLVEENHDESKHDYYEQLTLKYFLDSYEKFSNNPEYLFYTGITACMSEWYFDIELEDAEEMIQKSMQLEPDNIIYQWAFYGALSIEKYEDKKTATFYAQIIFENESPIKKILQSKGSIGHYLLGIMTHWSNRVITQEIGKPEYH